MRREERYQRVLEHFRREMPTVDTELQFGSVFQLLVAVVLSAQCTDKRVNAVTPPNCSATIPMCGLWRWPRPTTCWSLSAV